MNIKNLQFSWKPILIMLLTTLPAWANAQWTNDVYGAIISKGIPGKNSELITISLAVSYYPERGCKPEVSVIFMHGMKLGSGEKQHTFKKSSKQLQITVDGNMYTNETKVTKYANGFEYSMFAPHGLIKAMDGSPKSINVRLGEVIDHIDFSGLYGFAQANQKAIDKCQ